MRGVFLHGECTHLMPPLQKPLGQPVEAQVYGDDLTRFIKGADKAEWDRLQAKLKELSQDKPADPPTACAGPVPDARP